MSSVFALNVIFGSCLIIILIFIDYSNNYNTDRFQRRIFCRVLFCVFVSAVFNMAYHLAAGRSGMIFYYLVSVFSALHFLFLAFSFYSIGIFADYTIFRDQLRTRKITIVARVICVIYFVILALNMKFRSTFYITENNALWRDDCIVRAAFNYAPILFMLFDFISSRKIFKKHHLYMILLFVCLSFAGPALDTFFGTARLVWPCLTAALLYAYFFIIRTDIQIDSLTGIGNRYSFNEFIDKLARLNSGESYAIVMIDMDHFKEINDTLGHQEGDNALRDMAAIIKNNIRGSDFAARYGGDEFILAASAKHQIEKLMNRIQHAINVQNEKRIRPFDIQISYGYDVYTSGGGQTIEEFLAHIDRLMYKHKEERRRSSDNPGEANA